MAIGRRILWTGVLVVAGLGIFGAGWIAGRAGIGPVVEPASLTDAERAFAERMRGVTLVGSFTTTGRENRTPRDDRYVIDSVEKIGDDLWRFNARMDCCGLDGRAIPIAIPMRWVGDTPMIMMTDTSLPGIGTFTVRLFFYEDRYAGTWQGGRGGGIMYGRLEKSPAP